MIHLNVSQCSLNCVYSCVQLCCLCFISAFTVLYCWTDNTWRHLPNWMTHFPGYCVSLDCVNMPSSVCVFHTSFLYIWSMPSNCILLLFSLDFNYKVYIDWFKLVFSYSEQFFSTLFIDILPLIHWILPYFLGYRHVYSINWFIGL